MEGLQAVHDNQGSLAGMKAQGASDEAAESDALLQKLFLQAWIPPYQCRFRWRADSLAFWDNRAAQHYAAADYWPHRCEMERVTIVGSCPY